jgi:ABC-type amino acid transport substrate-binding protein
MLTNTFLQSKSRRRYLKWATALVCAPTIAFAQQVENFRDKGVLKVAVYNANWPFSGGTAHHLSGLDVDLAQALAQKLGLKVSYLPFDAGENMNDDLRNMVWKGHYLGYGPADVMLHVPVDRVLMTQNDKVHIFAPYYRENIVVAHRLERLPQVRDMGDLLEMPVAAERGTSSASALLGALQGRLSQHTKILNDSEGVLSALVSGQVAAVLATRSQIEAYFFAHQVPSAEFGVSSITAGGLPPHGWAIGLSVREDRLDLAQALDGALQTLVRDGEVAALYAKHGVTWRAP